MKSFLYRYHSTVFSYLGEYIGLNWNWNGFPSAYMWKETLSVHVTFYKYISSHYFLFNFPGIQAVNSCGFNLVINIVFIKDIFNRHDWNCSFAYAVKAYIPQGNAPFIFLSNIEGIDFNGYQSEMKLMAYKSKWKNRHRHWLYIYQILKEDIHEHDGIRQYYSFRIRIDSSHHK